MGGHGASHRPWHPARTPEQVDEAAAWEKIQPPVPPHAGRFTSLARHRRSEGYMSEVEVAAREGEGR